jgi:hypothetical protein
MVDETLLLRSRRSRLKLSFTHWWWLQRTPCVSNRRDCSMILSTAPLNIYGISLEPAGAFTSLYTLEWPYHKEENSPDQIIPSFRLLESTYLWRPTFMKPVKPSTGIIQGRQRSSGGLWTYDGILRTVTADAYCRNDDGEQSLSLSTEPRQWQHADHRGSTIRWRRHGECRLEDALEFISPCRAASR